MVYGTVWYAVVSYGMTRYYMVRHRYVVIVWCKLQYGKW